MVGSVEEKTDVRPVLSDDCRRRFPGPVGDHTGLRAGVAMFDYVISGIVSALLLVYLGWAMFKPEKF
jgi:K+-transporting ATPase KdpF subunit